MKKLAAGLFRKFAIVFAVLVIVSFSRQTNAQSIYQQILRMVDSVSTENLSAHIQWLEEPGGENSRVNFTPGNDSAAVYIKNEFDKIDGLTSVKFDTFYISSATPPLDSKPMVNIVATLDGTGSPNSYFVLGAHLDCSASRMGSAIWNAQWQTITAPGADDNATGVAAILEIARILADSANNFQHDYGLKFIAFGAEESGPAYSGSHHGSRHFAQFAKQNNHDVRGMASIDMIGYNDNYDYQSIVSNIPSSTFAQKFLDAKDIFSIDLLIHFLISGDHTYSDHDTFWNEGYPAVLFIENAPPWNNSQYYIANPFYHKSTDTFETLNMELVTKVTKLNLATFAAFSAPLTDVAEEKTTIQDGYYLSQNYPNPFNPATKIKYELPNIDNQQSIVAQLIIYDILGNEIAILLHEEKSPGTYEVEFDGTNFSSGVYFYTLKFGANSITNKMVLMK